MPRAVRFALLPVLLALAACGDADTTVEVPAEDLTTADAVADLVGERFERNVGDVDSFTVVGAGVEARYVATGDTTGMEPFRVSTAIPNREAVDSERAPLLMNQFANGRMFARGLRAAEFGGVTTRDGRRVYVLSTDDPASIFGGGAPADSTQQEMRVYVDAETFDITEIYRSTVPDSAAAPVTERLIYSDFRTVDGLTLPFSVRQVVTGLQIPEEDKMLMGGQIGIQRNMLQNQPASAERDSLLAQLDAQERMLTRGIYDQTLVVSEVRVAR